VLEQLTYLPVMLTHAGFAPSPPKWEQVQNGDFDAAVLPADAPALVLWLEAFEIGAGDRVSWRITGPDGQVLFEDGKTEPKAQRQAFRFAGKRRPAEGWQPGTYSGTVRIERDGAPVQERSLSVELR
jgi:hypothetical protein